MTRAMTGCVCGILFVDDLARFPLESAASVGTNTNTIIITNIATKKRTGTTRRERIASKTLLWPLLAMASITLAVTVAVLWAARSGDELSKLKVIAIDRSGGRGRLRSLIPRP